MSKQNKQHLRDIWQNIDETLTLPHQYVDYSKKFVNNLTSLVQVLKLLETDEYVTHINISSNISSHDVSNPLNMRVLFNTFQQTFSRNKKLLSINISDNHLFENSDHPTNDHLSNYAEDFVKILLNSSIDRVDLSGNAITGPSRRMLKGLSKLMKDYYCKQGKLLICKHSGLHGLAYKSIACGLGTYSTLTYLDLSDNFGGLDAYGNSNSEGFAVFTQQLCMTPSLRVLRLANNYLHDDEIILLSNSIATMHTIKLLDISNNYCLANGAEALKNAILSHSTLTTPTHGIEQVYLSGNPLGYAGMVRICDAILGTDTLGLLELSQCNIEDDAMAQLQVALAANHTIKTLNITSNPAKPNLIARAEAEATAVQLIEELYEHPLNVDAGELTQIVYLALSKKLRFLPIDTLKQLHVNASFNEPHSIMATALHTLAPLSRNTLVKRILDNDNSIRLRIEDSKKIDARAQAAYTILRVAIRWRNKQRLIKRIQKAISQPDRTHEYRLSDIIEDKYGYN